MLTSDYLIINRKPQKFSRMRIAGRAAVFTDQDGRPLDNGVLILDDTVYAVLYCDEVRNVTMVTDRGGVRNVVTILWHTDEGYRRDLALLNDTDLGHFSMQNIRLNRYAEAIAAKLDEGVRLRVADAVDESDMAVCPECGMLNPAGSRYCLDCGAEIS